VKERFDRRGPTVRISSEEEDNNNVIDISNRDELMSRIVESDAVKLVQIGTSGKNYCVTLTKNALIALREGKSFPIDMMVNGEKASFTIMRDVTFRKNLTAFNKANVAAKKSADEKVEANKEVEGLGKDIGNKIIT